MADYDSIHNVQKALRRYNTMAERDLVVERYDPCGPAFIPHAAWHGIAERLICAALCNSLRGQSLQFVADRVNDALLRAGVTDPAALWRPSRVQPSPRRPRV